ncbi:MAG: porin family protein [Hyphomicrobiaceae bacterium]
MSDRTIEGAACLVLIFAAIFDFGASAHAGGKSKKRHYEPPPTSSWSDDAIVTRTPAIWTGLYAGLSLGYGWGHSEQDYERNNNHGLASTSPSGGLGALTLGYNYALGNGFVIGAEGDIGLMDVSADDKIVYDGHIYKTRFGPWWGTLRARAGYAFGDTLVYGTGGVAFMDVDEVSIGNTPGETAVNEDWRTGYALGAGVEHVISPGMTAKLEYLHLDFGKYYGFSANNEPFSFDNQVDLIRAGVNFAF